VTSDPHFFSLQPLTHWELNQLTPLDHVSLSINLTELVSELNLFRLTLLDTVSYATSFSRQFCLVSALYDFSFITGACSSALTLYAVMTFLVSALYDFSFITGACSSGRFMTLGQDKIEAFIYRGSGNFPLVSMLYLRGHPFLVAAKWKSIRHTQ